MDKKLKIILLCINALILILAIFWQISDIDYEPIIVIFGQFAAIIILLFESKISSTRVKKVKASKVKIVSSKDDDSGIEVENIEKGSDIDIRKE